MTFTSKTNDDKIIVYEESFWTGKKNVRIDGENLQKLDKKTFTYDDKSYTLKGSFLFGAKLVYGEESITLVPNLKWWQYILVLLPFIMVIGGAIGGICGALFAIISVICMRSFKNIGLQVLFGILCIAGAVFAWYIAALTILGSAALIFS